MRDYSLPDTHRAPERDVTITGVDTAVIRGNFDWNLVRVHTDAGVSGLGEAYRGGAIADIVAYVEETLVGENPLDVERLFRLIVQETSGHGGTTGKVVTAASGIEIALWDLAGKLLGLPTYQLLGGKYRDEVRLYVDLHAGESYAVAHGATDYADDAAYQADAYAERATEALELGYDAMKFDLDAPADNDPEPTNGRLSPTHIEAKREVVAGVMDAVDGRAEVAFDCHWDYELGSGKRLARALEPYPIMWLEDVLPPESMDAQRELARSTSTPLATGENRFRVHEFTQLLADCSVDVVTPDPATVGGLAEAKAIANRAEERYLTFAPHNVCSPVGTAAMVHLCAAVPNASYLEYHALDVDWWEDLLDRDDPFIEDGRIAVSEAPGHGVELDESVARDHAVSHTDGFFTEGDS
ncbi:mandelate racemase/muconate lactonizing enzyme family protein [Halobaculum limi]|uniref:mandelate racemase/muconate lactonizing enzyme family protein n=1 Tax=Halobaculum limi TaxID=3031916 RepID=UPI00240575D9|nr:mandelate racemase/muconate lactonizing enzyme family protein [Halobaculum sp. YSMS11]